MRFIRLFLFSSIMCLFLTPTPCFAQPQAQGPQATEAIQALTKELTPPEGGAGAGYPDLTSQAALLVFLALLPFLIMLLTSFMKMVITLALLRSALGVQQTPPNQVINGIAILLTMYVMYPTGLQMYDQAKHLLEGELPKELFSANSAAFALDVINVTKEPLRDFLIRNTRKQQLQGFEKVAKKTFPQEALSTLKETDFIIVVPAFITTQIRAAFEIGVLIYLPFFVIDLVTSNILLAMGMMMLSPLTIALPLKLLLIVMVDGWSLIIQGLVLSFH